MNSRVLRNSMSCFSDRARLAVVQHHIPRNGISLRDNSFWRSRPHGWMCDHSGASGRIALRRPGCIVPADQHTTHGGRVVGVTIPVQSHAIEPQTAPRQKRSPGGCGCNLLSLGVTWVPSCLRCCASRRDWKLPLLPAKATFSLFRPSWRLQDRVGITPH